MTGNFENWEEDNEHNDEWALTSRYAAVVPVKIDMTAYDFCRNEALGGVTSKKTRRQTPEK